MSSYQCYSMTYLGHTIFNSFLLLFDECQDIGRLGVLGWGMAVTYITRRRVSLETHFNILSG
jgi:hypothetical protein